MKQILVFGAGRSSSVLIKYLLKESGPMEWKVTVADFDLKMAQQKVEGHPNGRALQVNIENEEARGELIQVADIVVSLLPVSMHYFVVKDCIKYRKHMVTASYLSEEMYSLDDQFREQGILFVGEMGLDPGIDHMSAMEVINRLRGEGKKIKAFKSFTGGLIAPESDDNPWHYKFTWNPRNVVLAGQGTAQYLKKGKYKYIPYNRVFRQTEDVFVNGLGKFEAYANRDSLLYKTIYKLEDIPTLIRGTLRYPGYCRAWDAFVKLGWTDDSYPIINSEKFTYRQMLESYLDGVYHRYPKGLTIQKRLAEFLDISPDDPIIGKLEWLGIFENKKIKLKNATPAQILQHLLIQRWSLNVNDKDMVVMQHQFEYEKDNKKSLLKSNLVIKGDDTVHTAMAKLVGMPIGIFVKLILKQQIRAVGVHIPVISEIYEPVLEELKKYGVEFEEEVVDL